jgi:hypothetical protein
MEVTRGTAYGVALSQVAVTLGVILFCPGVDVNVVLARVHINTTAFPPVLEGGTEVRDVHLSMGFPILLASALAAMFSTVTYQTHQAGIAEQDYQPDVMDQAPMWDLLFWAYTLLAHAIIVLVVADPVDLFGCIAATSFMTYFLRRACAPKGQAVNLTRENLNMLGYSAGVLMTAFQMTGTRGYGTYVLALVVVLDYFLGLGHTYDSQATIATVSNCRLFYICIGTLGTAVMYALYGENGYARHGEGMLGQEPSPMLGFT